MRRQTHPRPDPPVWGHRWTKTLSAPDLLRYICTVPLCLGAQVDPSSGINRVPGWLLVESAKLTMFGALSSGTFRHGGGRNHSISFAVLFQTGGVAVNGCREETPENRFRPRCPDCIAGAAGCSGSPPPGHTGFAPLPAARPPFHWQYLLQFLWVVTARLTGAGKGCGCGGTAAATTGGASGAVSAAANVSVDTTLGGGTAAPVRAPAMAASEPSSNDVSNPALSGISGAGLRHPRAAPATARITAILPLLFLPHGLPPFRRFVQNLRHFQEPAQR